jgi:hypothetical protein
MATIYTAFALIVVTTGGPDESTGDVSISHIILAYYGAGVVAGPLVGALVPLTRWWLGRLFVSVIAAFVFFVCIGVATDGPFWEWEAPSWKKPVFLGCLLGLMGSLIGRNFRSQH